MSEIKEVDHIGECPRCDTVFVGATPDDVRQHLRDECDPLGAVLVWRQTA